MTVDRREVQRIASLARLRFDETEADRLADEMNDILEYAARLREFRDDLVEQEPGMSASGTRPQEAESPDPLSEGLASFAPREADGFFVVPPLPGLSPDAPLEEGV